MLKLWPDRPPGAPDQLPQTRIEHRQQNGVHPVAIGVGDPHVEVVRAPKPNGSALLLMPGGGYVEQWFEKEGFDIARRFASAGVTSFVLRYRLPGEGWADPAEAPLQDAQRAIRLIRVRAAEFGVDPDRICAMGFSAGAHLAAMLSVRRSPAYAPIDAADDFPTQPDLCGLVYPLLDLGMILRDGPFIPLFGASPDLEPPDLEAIAAYTPGLLVDDATPPAFIVQAADDELTPMEHSLAYAAALRTAKVPLELHVFEEGGHGFGLGGGTNWPVAAWPDLFLAWLSRRGFLTGQRG